MPGKKPTATKSSQIFIQKFVEISTTQNFEEKPEKISQRTASTSKKLYLNKGIKFSAVR